MKWRAAVCAVALAVAVTGCSTAAPRPVSTGPHLLGVAGVPVSGLPGFDRATGIQPRIVEFYTTFGAPPRPGRLTAISSTGALPLIQLAPYRMPLAAITAGKYDSYLRHYATGLRSTGHQVVLSFAPEGNGFWYPWACRHVPAAGYVAAWRHVHNVMARYDKQIIWLWDVNAIYHNGCPLSARWPGASYVNWVGVDGYLRYRGDSFETVLASTIRELHGSTGKPVLIAETGVPDVPQAPSWLRSIFVGAEQTPGVIGLVYFDLAAGTGNYRLEDDPPALAVFHREAPGYQSGSGS